MDATLRFAEVLALPDPKIPLDEAGLLIAAHGRPDLDVAAELERIDALAAGVTDPTLTGVVRHLFRDLGFAGNRDDYYDAANSFLDQVVSRRTGIPITLSVLTMEVARRVSVPLSGVGMPGHFLLRDKVDRNVFVDAFDNGRFLDADGCARLFRRIHGPGARLDPAYLEPIPRARIIARVLENLRGIYLRAGDHASLRWVLRLRTLLAEAGAAEWRDLAGLLGATGDLVAAAEATERAATLAGSDDERAADLVRAAHLRARLN